MDRHGDSLTGGVTASKQERSDRVPVLWFLDRIALAFIFSFSQLTLVANDGDWRKLNLMGMQSTRPTLQSAQRGMQRDAKGRCDLKPLVVPQFECCA